MCILKKQQKIEGTHGDENISDINKWLHVITFTNISNAAEVLVKFRNHLLGIDLPCVDWTWYSKLITQCSDL